MEVKKKKLLSLGIIVLLLVGGIIFFWLKKEPNEWETNGAFSEESTIVEKETEKTTSTQDEKTDKKIYVDMKGEVRHPGMYPLQEGDRVYDAITAAGGLTKEAAKEQLDFAQKVQDEMTVIVPKKGEKKKDWIRYPKGKEPMSNAPQDSIEEGNASSGVQGQEGGKVSVNHATSEQLQTIDGIGEKKAQKIIQYRQEKGQIQSLDELQNIDGFGEKTVAKLKKALVL